MLKCWRRRGRRGVRCRGSLAWEFEVGGGSGNVEWKTFLCVCKREVKTLAQRENALKNKTATTTALKNAMTTTATTTWATTTAMSGKKSQRILQKMRTKWVCRNNFKSSTICIANNKSCRCDVIVEFAAVKLMLFMNHFQFIHGVWVIYGICAPH